MPAHHEYRKEWVAAGYRSDMASAIAARPPRDANYLRVYHLTSADYAMSNLALGRLKVARFSDLNDPFELIAVNFKERPVRKVARDFKSAYDVHTGLLCFSDDWAEPVLWSHYAAKHRGICLGFNVPRQLMQEVRYKPERLLAKLDENDNPMTLPVELQEQLLCTKYGGWKYEQEHRRFVALRDSVSEGSLHFMPFGKELELTEVVVGPECNVAVAEVRKLVDSLYAGAVTFKARLAFKFFKIVPDEREVI
jgi:hypothetical protein